MDHTNSAEDLVAIGRDAEVAALAKAVRWHREDKASFKATGPSFFR